MSQLNHKRELLADVRRVVVKVGSAVLSDQDGLRIDVIGGLAAQIEQLTRTGLEIVLVTSGAIAAGRARLRGRAATIAERQAAAAAGQIELMRQWA
ncbi:glutamate 5-kinase, partial [bacterium]|nr:glutamate 5-kinase [bacterium]